MISLHLKDIMRINLWAGSGCGKSTVASGLFHTLKCKNLNVELVREYIKQWAYEGRKPIAFQQVYIFGKQLHAEDSVLQHVDHLVTDSPLLMQVFYARRYNFECWPSLLEIGRAFDAKYPSCNILLDRVGITFQQKGRYEDEEGARKVDVELEDYMKEFSVPYTKIPCTEMDTILNSIKGIMV